MNSLKSLLKWYFYVLASRRLSGAGFEAMSSLSKDLLQSLMQTASFNDSKQNQLLSENFLGSVAKMWASGKLSNFDYIMLLNYLCGRTFSNPNHYPVLPWVRDYEWNTVVTSHLKPKYSSLQKLFNAGLFVYQSYRLVTEHQLISVR